MLHLEIFTFNAFQENTYVVYNNNQEAWIIDPGMMNSEESKRLLDFLQSKNLQPQAIYNTHAHIDHVLGVAYLQDKFSLDFHLHPKEEVILNGAAGSAVLFGMPWKGAPKATFSLDAGKKLMWGNSEIEMLFVPGHSPGSIAFYAPDLKWVIAGDALFAGSIGRTDLPGGNHQQLIECIQSQLFTLPDDVRVYPGHGPHTTIGVEKNTNPFFLR